MNFSEFLKNKNNLVQMQICVKEEHLESWKKLDKDIINILDINEDYGSYDVFFEYNPHYISILLHRVFHIGNLYGLENGLLINKSIKP